MALPTYATVLTQINTYIVANGNNEITANVLNPVLELILDFANNNIGDLDALTTDEKNSIVEAINSLKQNFEDLVNNGVQLYTGIDDPNVTPPPTYKYADFYMQVDIDALPVKLWQWNGFEWTDESGEPATDSDNVNNNSDVPGFTVTDALDYLNDNLPTGDEYVIKTTITEIRALSGLLPNPYFYTTDLGQQGNWYYDASDTTSADNTGTILVTSDGKRIKRIYSGAVNVSWYGIFANSVSDYSSAFATVVGLHNDIDLNIGNYNITLTSATVFSNKIIRGAKPSWNGTTISGGTTITGSITAVGNDNTFINLGVINPTGGANGITLRDNASRNIIDNCIFKVANHAVLIEQFGGTATDNIVRDCDAYGGIHGFVSKSKNATFRKCRSFTASQDGFAMVSDNITGLAFPSLCLNNTLIDCEAYNTNTGIAIYSRDYTSTTNTAGILFRNLSIIGGNIDTCSAYGIALGDSIATGSVPGGQTYNDVESVSVTGIKIQNTVTSNIQLGRANGVYIGGNNFKGLVNRAFNFTKNLNLDKNNNNNFSQGNSVYNTINTVNGTNIDASLVNEYVETNNTSTTVMSTITNGKVGQVMKIFVNDNFTIIPKSSTYRLSKTYIRGKGSFVLLKYANDGSGWDEIFSQCVDNFQSFTYNANLDIDYKFANNAEVFLTGNVSTLVFSNLLKGNVIKLILQSNSGIRTLAGWDSRIVWLNGTAPTGVDVNTRLSLEFYFNGTNIINIGRSDGITDLLTGYTSGAGTVSASDSVLSAIQKLNGNDALKANLASPALTGTPTAPTATAGTNNTQLATTAFVQGVARPYKSYSSLIVQTGVLDPVPTIMENQLSGAIVWTRTGVGVYLGTLTGAFTAFKTLAFGILSSASVNYKMGITCNSVNTIQIATVDNANAPVDGVLNASIEVRVYN